MNESSIFKITNLIIGGLQAHQHWRRDGISPSCTAAMGMGGGRHLYL